MKEIFTVYLAHLLKQHESEPLTRELNDRLINAALLHAEQAFKALSKVRL